MDPLTPNPDHDPRQLEEGILFALWTAEDLIDRYTSLATGQDREIGRWINKLDYNIGALSNYLSEILNERTGEHATDIKARWEAKRST